MHDDRALYSNYLLLALLGTGTWVLANAACVPSVRQQQGSDGILYAAEVTM
jgi:hypothetical protein